MFILGKSVFAVFLIMVDMSAFSRQLKARAVSLIQKLLSVTYPIQIVCP